MLDLSGGFDTLAMLAFLLNSGIDMNEILVNTKNDTSHYHDQDIKIAWKISKKFGFKLNNLRLNKNSTKLSMKNSIFLSTYTKLGFHKEFYLKNEFYSKPIFSFTGNSGEIIRGIPCLPINKYIKIISSNGKEIRGHNEEFYNSSLRLCNRSLDLLKKKKTYNNDYEIAADFYVKGRQRNHFGKAALESFLANIYTSSFNWSRYKTN